MATSELKLNNVSRIILSLQGTHIFVESRSCVDHNVFLLFILISWLTNGKHFKDNGRETIHSHLGIIWLFSRAINR